MMKLTLGGLILILVFIQSNLFAQSGDTFRQWGEETFSQIERDFRLSNSNLYRESMSNQNIAFNWPQGVQLHALIAAGKIIQAEAMANEMHQKYWCNYKDRWGYNATANSCGDRYYDDNAWIAKALMELYFETNNIVYLNRAKEVVAFSMSGENMPGDDPNGGIRWKEGEPGGQCLCSTAPTMTANLMIYEATGDSRYLDDGRRLYEWVRANRFGLGGGYRGYENAVVTQAAILLYQITKDENYYDDAKHLGLAMETVYVNYNTHALEETGQWGGHDMTAAYVDLYNLDGDVNWLNIASGYLTFLHHNCKDAAGRYPETWSDVVALGNPALLFQSSVARAYGAMGNTPGGATKYPDPVAVYRDADYNSYYSAGLSVGEYTAADLDFLGMPDNNITSVKVLPGYRVVLFKDDNFQGNSLVKTSNSNYLGAEFNDVVSSLKVESVSPYVIVYTDCNYSGKAVNLPASTYTLGDLRARGINNKDISSIQVGEGYQVTLFKNDSLEGESIMLNADIECLNEVSWNDSTTSVRVDCNSSPIIPYLSVNGGELKQTSTAEVILGSSVKFSPITQDGGTWSWLGPDLTSNHREISLTNLQPGQSGTYSAFYTSSTGCVRTHDFVVSVTPYVTTMYSDCNFSGSGVSLAVGDYDMFALIAKGIVNDDVSSLKIAPGFEVEVFEDYNFTGKSYVLKGDVDCLSTLNLNNWISSAKVRTSSNPTSVEVLKGTDETFFEVYPNPTDNYLILKSDQKFTNAVGTVFNCNGKVAQRIRLNTNKIDVSSLRSGLYFLVIQTQDKTITRKFVKK